MSLSLLRPLLLASLIGFAGIAQAAPVTVPVDPAGNFTITEGNPPVNYNFNVQPSTFPNPAVHYDANVPDQSVDNIRVVIAAAYSASSSTLATASVCDSIAGGCPGLTTTNNTFQLTNVTPFDYLAIHYGGGELFFHWASPITSVLLTAINGFPNGLSNYRSYLTTPVPGALALFLGALGFLGLRRKLAQPAGAEPTPA